VVRKYRDGKPNLNVIRCMTPPDHLQPDFPLFVRKLIREQEERPDRAPFDYEDPQPEFEDDEAEENLALENQIMRQLGIEVSAPVTGAVYMSEADEEELGD
jgi:hypothetical protein